jgi:hypothetical protein
LSGNLGPTPLGLVFVDDASVQVGINGHLAAWHSIQGEPGGYLTDSGSTFGNHHELYYYDDAEYNDSNYDMVASHKLAEASHYPSCRHQTIAACPSEYQPGGGNIKN